MAMRVLVALLVVTGMCGRAEAHVGNKDVYQELTVGPYKLFVTVRMPVVIPGVATVEVRSIGAPVDSLEMMPLLLTGEASKHPPTADAMKPNATDKQFFSGTLWIMGSGSWQIRLNVKGAAGAQTASVPVPAVPTKILRMQKPLGVMLGALGLLLVAGFVGIVTGATREARLVPGAAVDAKRKRWSLVMGGAALVFAVFAVAMGGWWWNVEAADYASHMHKNSELRTTLEGDELVLHLGDPDAEDPKKWDEVPNKDLLLDHGHVMHLYAIREPEMDEVFHLHPEPTGKAGLALALPAMPAGTYKLYGDVVFPSGFPETETATLTVPAGATHGPLGAEDASAAPAPLSAGMLGASYKLPDGYSMVWDKPATVDAATGYLLRFTLVDASGKPASEMQPYLGMAGHAAFVKTDGTAFAHTHPEGTAAMPAVMLAEDSSMGASMPGMDMSGMKMADEPVTPTVEFPYGFPSAGRYRIFVQMKHAGVVETGVFDVDVK